MPIFSAIAEKMGITRQRLHQIYPDLETIYLGIYAEIRRQFLAESENVPSGADELTALLKRRCATYLAMPPACAVVALAALHGGSRSTRLEVSLREGIYDNLRTVWVEPLAAAGYDRDEVFSTTVGFASVMFGLVVAINRGLTTPEFAYVCLTEAVDGLISSWSQPRTVLA